MDALGELVVAERQVHLGVHLLRNALSTLQAQQYHLVGAEFARAVADELVQRRQTELAASALEFVRRSQAGHEEKENSDSLRTQSELLLGTRS